MSDVIPDLELELAELRDEHVAGSAAKRSEIAASIARMIQGLEHVLREASEEVTAARSELTRGLIALNGSVLIAAVAMFSTNELRTIVAVAGFAAWWGLINAFAYWLFNLGLPLIADGYLTRMKRYQLEWEAFEALVDATPTSVREMKSALNKQKNFIGRIARSTRFRLDHNLGGRRDNGAYSLFRWSGRHVYDFVSLFGRRGFGPEPSSGTTKRSTISAGDS